MTPTDGQSERLWRLRFYCVQLLVAVACECRADMPVSDANPFFQEFEVNTVVVVIIDKFTKFDDLLSQLNRSAREQFCT